jgi:hypothetical protein
MNCKSILACVFVVCGLLTCAVGQGRGDSQGSADRPQTKTKASEGHRDQSDVEVKNDGFSGAMTVTLKPQVLINSQNHKLDMEMETKLGGKRLTGVPETDETVIITFTSLSNGGVDLGDEELHFLVDGKPIKGGESSGGTPSRVDDPNSKFKIRKRLINSLSLVDVQRLARGKRVEMRLGPIELTFDEKLMTRIQAFVAAAPSRYK